MRLGTKKIAFLGLLLALTVACTILSSVIEISTLFFLAAGAFLVGAAIHETGIGYGIAFYLASVFLSIIVTPNKIYCLTFAMIAGYILIVEWIQLLLQRKALKQLATLQTEQRKSHDYRKLFWIVKLVLFNLMYLPILFWFPKLIFPGNISSSLLLIAIIVGQAVFVVFDLAYQSFFERYWKRIRKALPFR